MTKNFEVNIPQITVELTEREVEKAREIASGFVPGSIVDIHTHLMRATDYADGTCPAWCPPGTVLDLQSLRSGVAAWLPEREVRGVCFGLPARGARCGDINAWIRTEVEAAPGWSFLALCRPDDDPAGMEQLLSHSSCKGFKVYHLFNERPDSFDCLIEDFAPEWMWDILNQHDGILMLHIVRSTAMADPENQKSLSRLCRKYPRCRLVLAHIARSFSYRHALEGLGFLRDLDNAMVDTSAVCESRAFEVALEMLGPARVMYGSDYPVSNFLGRCVTLADSFHWLHPGPENPEEEFSLVGVESLRALREAAEAVGLTQGDLELIFSGNARALLGEATPAPGPTWAEVKTHITCGTGLMSKRQEQFDADLWPTFFSRCSGADVWDVSGHRFVDFAGGVGAILLGYADPDVGRAVRRRVAAGTYCTLVNPEEDELARLLLELHPWAGRVRFARGGGEAVTMAVRVARAATGRSGVLFCGYHGWQDWYLAANLGSSAALDGHLLPGLVPSGVPRELKGTSVPFRYNDFGSLQEALATLGSPPAAIVMEPMRSSLPADGFLEKVKQLAAAQGAVFILDEITSGWRFGWPGAHARLGIEPDIAVYAKAMSNGFPCAALVGREAVIEASAKSFISSSYWTDGVGTTAALATIRKIRSGNISSRVWETGLVFSEGLRAVAARNPVCKLSVGGMPPSPALTFDLGESSARARQLFIRGMAGRGFLASSQLYLMAAHTPAQQRDFLQAAEMCLSEIAAGVERGDLGVGPTNANLFSRLT